MSCNRGCVPHLCHAHSIDLGINVFLVKKKKIQSKVKQFYFLQYYVPTIGIGVW